MNLAVLVLLPFLNFGGHAGAVSQSFNQKYEAGYTKRADFFLSLYDTLKSPDYYSCAIKYARHVDLQTANKNALLMLKHPTGDMFWMVAVMDMYLHGKNDMSPAVKEAIRNAWKTYTPYRGDTENHWLQYHSMLFLASEQWPNLPGSDWYNGRSSKTNLRDSKNFLLAWMKETTTIGSGEFDSPDYFPEYFNPLVLLAEYAKDPEIKQMANMMCDYYLAEFATESLDGQFVGGYSRVYEPAVYEPSRSNVNAYAYLYFDQGAAIHSGWVTIAALSNYRPPKIIYDIAHDRSKPYVNTSIKRVRNNIRYGKERNPKVFKYDYIDSDYAIGSIQGGFLQPIQQHTWGLFFTHGFPFTEVFSIEPYWSGLELGTFFPEERETMIASVIDSKGTYNKPNKWTGSSPFERTFQHKNTLIVLYNIAPGTNTEYVDGFFPKALDTLISDWHGWIVGKAGTAYFGWYPLQPYEWMNEGTYTELRSYHPQNGLVLEARDKSQVGSFDHFLSLLKNHKPSADLNPKHVAVTYRTLNGKEMHFVFPDVRELNGKKVNMMDYRYYKGPFLNSAYGSQVETITCKGMKMILNFKKLTISGSGN
ncbi:MAG: hypothetical protein M1469_04530 [Bacteroidetes bacterium]|nr:hypothetical protein [Bacteroidota bacterium]MCL5267354.1 hypothetical protein [Bacteroidota bacterium]